MFLEGVPQYPSGLAGIHFYWPSIGRPTDGSRFKSEKRIWYGRRQIARTRMLERAQFKDKNVGDLPEATVV